MAHKMKFSFLFLVDILCGMVIHRVRIPATPYIRIDKVLGYIEIKWDDSLIFEDEDLLCLHEDIHSLLSSRLKICQRISLSADESMAVVTSSVSLAMMS